MFGPGASGHRLTVVKCSLPSLGDVRFVRFWAAHLRTNYEPQDSWSAVYALLAHPEGSECLVTLGRPPPVLSCIHEHLAAVGGFWRQAANFF